MEPASRLDHNGQLTLQDFPYIIQWREDRCTRCGRCTAVCPQQAIEPAVFARRLVYSESGTLMPSTVRKITHGIRQVNDIERYCTGCGMCSLVCPNAAIAPYYNPRHKFLFHKNLGGTPYKRGGRRNDPSPSTLDKLKFTRISMLTDPALDAGRHEFHIRTLLGRILPPEKLPLKVKDNLLTVGDDTFIPPVREIFPIRIGSMSIGAVSPPMWEGLAMGITYLNEVEGMPVVMCSGEGGMPPRLLRSRFLKYFIPQIASGYFGWDEIIHALPDMVEDPCAIEIKYGQGAKPGDGGLLMSYKVLKLIAGIRGVPMYVDLASPPTHQTKYSIEEAVAKMIQSIAAGGMGKTGNLAANAAAMIMLGASAVDMGKYIMQAAAGCLGDEYNRCNLCNTGKCPRGITTQNPRLYRRLDPDKVAERVVEVFKSAETELKKIFAPMGRSTQLPIGMSDGLSVGDKAIAERLEIDYAC